MSKGKAGKRKQRREIQRRIRNQDYAELPDQETLHTAPQRRKQRGPIEAKTQAQGQLMVQIDNKDIVFATGPAGTGKTYVSAGSAADQLAQGSIEKIIVCRPMQACDEDMGFLPGTEAEKYAPWVAPVAAVFEERLGKSYVESLVKGKRIEYMPLMTMRGASFKDAWILLDEAQNTTPEQMKMFLTRIGENCKMIISGDIRQSDRKDSHGSPLSNGLDDALYRVSKIPAVGHVAFTVDDIVRHGIIRDILAQYE